MPFCEHCQHYFPPSDATCPVCRTPALPLPAPALQWTAPLPGEPDALALAGGALWAATHTAGQATLTRVDPGHGAPLGQQTWDRAVITGLIPAGDVLQVALTTTDLLHGTSVLLALAADGTERWRWAGGRGALSAPAWVADRLYLVAETTTLLCLAAADGRERWRIPLPEPVTAARAAPVAVAAPELLLIPCRQPQVLALAFNGALRWRFAAPAPATAWLHQPPVVLGAQVYATSSTGVLYALRLDDGRRLWERPVGPAGRPLSAPATDGARLFVGARDGLHALAPDDGRPLWHFPTTRRIAAAPVVQAGVVYAVGHDHTLYALEAAGGRELWRSAVTHPADLPPLLVALPAAPGVVLAGAGGTLTALARPWSVAEHEAAGRWRAAAAGYADGGAPARGAALLAAHGEPYPAAQLWAVAGEPVQAAEQYELAGEWERAAALWAALAQPARQAAALERAAQAATAPLTAAEQWEQAAQLWAAEGESARAEACAIQAALQRGQPYLQVTVEVPSALRLGESRAFTLTVRNVGGGTALRLCLHRTSSAVQGDCASQQLRDLRAGRQCTQVLYLSPERAGELPLDLTLTYTDERGQPFERRYRAVLVVQATAPAQSVQLVGEFYGPVADVAPLRAGLKRLDDVELETLCLDHFPAVYEKFARGLRRDEKVNLLLDHCRRHPEEATRLAALLP